MEVTRHAYQPNSLRNITSVGLTQLDCLLLFAEIGINRERRLSYQLVELEDHNIYLLDKGGSFNQAAI